MSVTYGLEKISPELHGSALAVGVFDGVHWGHRAIFERLIEVSSEAGIRSVALTFEKHPAELLAPKTAPCYITTLEQRLELILAAGVERIVVAEFDAPLASLTPEDFLRRVVCDQFKARHIVVGSNFRFGRDRKGDIRYLASAAPAMGLGLSVVPSVVIGGGPVSSTRVRTVIARGDVETAAKLLGRRFTLRGTVVTGDRRGRSLGFPTANLQTSPRQLLPARGVYAVEAAVLKSVYSGVCSIGCRPTFGGGQDTIEVHLMGFEGGIYGETLDVVFCRRLRDEMVFETADKLAQQIRKDLQRVRSDGC